MRSSSLPKSWKMGGKAENVSKTSTTHNATSTGISSRHQQWWRRNHAWALHLLYDSIILFLSGWNSVNICNCALTFWINIFAHGDKLTCLPSWFCVCKCAHYHLEGAKHCPLAFGARICQWQTAPLKSRKLKSVHCNAAEKRLLCATQPLTVATVISASHHLFPLPLGGKHVSLKT